MSENNLNFPTVSAVMRITKVTDLDEAAPACIDDSNLMNTGKLELSDCMSCSGCLDDAEALAAIAPIAYDTILKKFTESSGTIISIPSFCLSQIALHFGIVGDNIKLNGFSMKIDDLLKLVKSREIFPHLLPPWMINLKKTQITRENLVLCLVEAVLQHISSKILVVSGDPGWNMYANALKSEYIDNSVTPENDESLPIFTSYCAGFNAYYSSRQTKVGKISDLTPPANYQSTFLKAINQLNSIGKKPNQILTVSIEPCNDNKLHSTKFIDYSVDISLTTTELISILNSVLKLSQFINLPNFSIYSLLINCSTTRKKLYNFYGLQEDFDVLIDDELLQFFLQYYLKCKSHLNMLHIFNISLYVKRFLNILYIKYPIKSVSNYIKNLLIENRIKYNREIFQPINTIKYERTKESDTMLYKLLPDLNSYSVFKSGSFYLSNENKKFEEAQGAYISGLANIQIALHTLNQPNTEINLIEISACPGGCKNGSGQLYYISTPYTSLGIGKFR